MLVQILGILIFRKIVIVAFKLKKYFISVFPFGGKQFLVLWYVYVVNNLQFAISRQHKFHSIQSPTKDKFGPRNLFGKSQPLCSHHKNPDLDNILPESMALQIQKRQIASLDLGIGGEFPNLEIEFLFIE